MADDPTYTFCLRFFAELRAAGVDDAVVSPGSRSTPLALSAKAAGLRVTIQLDERVGGFHALGQARATGRPSVLICTSGTAGANYLPAVVEAHHSAIPLIVCTADRPPELRQWGAGQTIDQVHMFGTNVRWFQELPVASEVPDGHARSMALRAVSSAVHQGGPVHLNWPFREPLEPSGPIVAPMASVEPVHPVTAAGPSPLLAALGARYERGLLVVGPADLAPTVAAELLDFAAYHGWPVVADPASGLRSADTDHPSTVVTTGELLFSSGAFTQGLPPCDVIVRVGPAPTSKAYRLWVEANRPQRLVLVAPGVEWADPTDTVTDVVPGPLQGAFGARSEAPRITAWSEVWERAETLAVDVATKLLHSTGADGHLSELCWASEVLEHLAGDAGVNLVVSSSMPVRDVDVAMRRTPGVRVIANRGANGIDGVIATAGGVAATDPAPTWVMVGDIAGVHDLGGLAAAARLGIANLTVVVIDNDEGGIFSFLPVAGVIDQSTYTELFATPHGTDLVAVAAALGYAATTIDHPAELPAVDAAGSGPRLVRVRTEARRTVEQMAELKAAVDDAVSAPPGT